MPNTLDLQEIITNLVLTNWKIITLLILLLIAKTIFTSPIFKGWWGEQHVTRFGLNKLDPTRYTTFNDLYLPRPDGQGSTQIDHLVISHYGLFVIETKNYKGWIFGSEKQRQWTQQIYKKKNKFQNPIHQNQLHINALTKFLNIEKSTCHNIIMFIGDCTLKTKLPGYVLTRGLRTHIQKFTEEILPTDTLNSIKHSLNQHIASQDKKATAKAHRKQFKAST